MGEQKKIKILRIINRFNIGGPTYNATFLTKFMSDDFETLLIGGLPEENEANSLHILKEYDVEPLLISEMKREPNLKSDRLALKKSRQLFKSFNLILCTRMHQRQVRLVERLLLAAMCLS